MRPASRERDPYMCLNGWNHIDVLVNNAGITKDALIRKMTDAEWSAVINVNLTGAIGSVISGVGLGKGVRASMVAWSSEIRVVDSGKEQA